MHLLLSSQLAAFSGLCIHCDPPSDSDLKSKHEQQVVKGFDERPHHRGQVFSRNNAMWHRPVGSIAPKLQSAAAVAHHAVKDWMISCCIHRSRDSQCISMGQTTPELPLLDGPVGISTHLVHVFWAHASQRPNGISISSAVLHSSPVCPTHRRPDHATCDVCSNKPHLRSACTNRPRQTNVYA